MKANTQNAVALVRGLVSVQVQIRDGSGYSTYDAVANKAVADTLAKDDFVTIKKLSVADKVFTGKVVKVQQYLDVDSLSDTVRFVIGKVDLATVEAFEAQIEQNKAAINQAKANKLHDEIQQYVGNQS